MNNVWRNLKDDGETKKARENWWHELRKDPRGARQEGKKGSDGSESKGITGGEARAGTM